MNTLPALDLEIFQEMQDAVAQQPTAVAALYGTFLGNATRLIATLGMAESATTREKTLHTLKGSAAMMGAARMARLAADLQSSCATMPAQAMQAAIGELEAELDAIQRAIDAHLDAGGYRGSST